MTLPVACMTDAALAIDREDCQSRVPEKCVLNMLKKSFRAWPTAAHDDPISRTRLTVQAPAPVFEESPVLTSALQDAGWKAIRYSPQQINAGKTSHITHDIKQGQYEFLWIDLPQAGRRVPKDRAQPCLNLAAGCNWPVKLE